MDGGVINLDELIQQYNSSINNSNYRIHLLLNSDIKSLNSLMEKYQRLLDLKNQSIEIENEIQQLESRKNMSLSSSPTARVYGEKLETARNEKKELLDKISYLSSEQIKEMNRIKDSVRKKMDEFKKRFMSEENFNNIIDEISKIKDPIMEKRKNLESKRDEIKQKLEELYRNRAEFEKNISNADGYDKLSMCRDNVENETNILYYEQQLNSYDLQINECKYQEKKVDKLKKRYRKYFLVEENNLEFSDFVWHFDARINSYSLENISLFIEDIESFQNLCQEKFGRVHKKHSVLEDIENYDDIYLDAVENAKERQQEVDEANEEFDLMSRQSLNDEEEWKKAYTNVRPSDPSDNDQNYDDIYLDAVEKAKERQQEVNEANKDYDLTSNSGLNDEEDWKNAYIESMNDKKNNNETNYDEIYLNAVRDAEKRQQEVNEANKDYNLTSKSGLNDEEEWKQAYIDSINDKEKEDREESKNNETNYDEIYLNAVNEAKKRQQEVDEANKDYNLTSKSGLNDEEEWKRAYEIEANKDKTLYTLEPEFDNGMYSKEASSKFDASMENMRRRWSGDFDYDSYYQAKKVAKNQYKDGEISKSEMKDRIKSAKSEYLSSVSDDEYIDYTSQVANQYMEDVKKEYSSDVKIDTRDTIEKINSDDEYNFRFQVNDASRKERLVNFVRNNKKGLMQSFLQAVYKKIGYVEEIINDDEYYDVAKSGRSR